MQNRYKRVLLKLSGEALSGDKSYGVDPVVLDSLSSELKEVLETGVQLAIVIGGGNIFRGVSAASEGMDRAHADYMGMLATCINALALQFSLENIGLKTRVMTAIAMSELAEPYIRRKAIRHLEKGRIVIFAAGTGNPFFTTDTAAALRGNEIGADLIMKATKVDGIFDKDPVKYSDAVLYQNVTHMETLQKGLQVMDATALSLCMTNRLPILVFNLLKQGNILKAVNGESIGTLVFTENVEE